MRNIFVLTKREQRIVIVIVTLLVAVAFARHFWRTKWEPMPEKSSAISGHEGIESPSPITQGLRSGKRP